jgi:hypothetical protein
LTFNPLHGIICLVNLLGVRFSDGGMVLQVKCNFHLIMVLSVAWFFFGPKVVRNGEVPVRKMILRD